VSDDTTQWHDLTNVKANSAKQQPSLKSVDTIDKKPDAYTPNVKTSSAPPLKPPRIDDTGLYTDHHKPTLVEDSDSCVLDVERSSDIQTIEFTCTFATVKDGFEITDTSIYLLAVQIAFNLAKCSAFIAPGSSFVPGHNVQTRIFIESKDVPSVMNRLESGKLAVSAMGESIYLHVSNPAVTTVSKVTKKDDLELVDRWFFGSM
jgi:hypothetical protein